MIRAHTLLSFNIFKFIEIYIMTSHRSLQTKHNLLVYVNKVQWNTVMPVDESVVHGCF